MLHGAHHADTATIQAHAAMLAERLASWPQWPEIAELEPVPDCTVPADARPQD